MAKKPPLIPAESAPDTIVIVGGGAAGLMAAYFAKLKHANSTVILVEKNSYLGAKILLSGGGRCNVTTGLQSVPEILKNYPRGADFLRTAMQQFPPRAVMDWFESQGVPLKTEPDRRVFPVSNDGKDIVKALENALIQAGVKILRNQQLTSVENLPDQKFKLIFNNRQDISTDRLIITTGGNAYRQTGSTGDGYTFATQLGHHITRLFPSLAALRTSEDWSHQLSGISFPSAALTLKTSSHDYQRLGPFLFTHQGVTGPAVFTLSSLSAFDTIDPGKPARLFIDFFPDQTAEKLLQMLDQKIDANPGKKTGNLIALFLPHSLAEKIVDVLLSPAFPEKQLTTVNAANLPKAVRRKIVATFKELPLTVISRSAGDEFVTAGGVDINEVNPKTMESQLRPGLFLAGELLDIDGFTGGFNLQASWATGALAGESV